MPGGLRGRDPKRVPCYGVLGGGGKVSHVTVRFAMLSFVLFGRRGSCRMGRGTGPHDTWCSRFVKYVYIYVLNINIYMLLTYIVYIYL